VNSKDDAEYRLPLARGFNQEAAQDYRLGRWRSCVDNAQLSLENAAKAIIAIRKPVEKTHDPARQLRGLVDKKGFDESLAEKVENALELFKALGFEEHFMTDYGDESTYQDPWTLFGEEDATNALETSRKCLEIAEELFRFYYPPE